MKDERVELWDVNVKFSDGSGDGKGEKWYRATVAYKTMTLLSFENWPYSRPWYFEASYIVTNDDAYWSSVSVARHLSGLQDAMNKYNSTLYNGSLMSAYPPIFGPELDSKDFRYSYGDYIPSDMAAQNFSPTINFHGQPILEHMQVLDSAGDRTARISANTQGAQSSHDATATESSIIAADVSVGIEEYIGNFGGALSEVAEFTMELLSLHFGEWQDEAAGMKVSQAQLASPCLWEPNGKSPGNTPGAKLAACEKLAALAAQFGPQTGIDIYELTRVIIGNCGLFGSDNIQISKDRLAPPATPAGAGVLPGGGAPGGGPPVPGVANPAAHAATGAPAGGGAMPAAGPFG